MGRLIDRGRRKGVKGQVVGVYSYPGFMARRVEGVTIAMQVGDHPYITSAYFWPFLTPPTNLISINTVLNVSKTGHFLDPPTQFFC